MVGMVRYVPPTSGQLEDIGKSATIVDQLEERTENGARHAAAISPVDTGEFAAGWEAVVDNDEVYLVNTAEHAVFVEYGTEDTPAHRIAAQAADFMEKGGA